MPEAKAISLEAISHEELRENWPQDDSGRLCARLLQRYCYTRLTESATGHECTSERAQAEAAATKTLAALTKDFATLARPAPEKPKRKPMQPLHRFQPEKTQPETK